MAQELRKCLHNKLLAADVYLTYGVSMKILIGLVFILFINVSFAEPLKSFADTKILADKMVSNFVKKEFKQGIELAKPHWPLPEVELNGLVNQIQTQWPIVDQRFGQAIGKEFVKEERIGASFVRYYYLHKFQNHSIYWNIAFYKPKDVWIVNGVQFLDTLDILYEVVK